MAFLRTLVICVSVMNLVSLISSREFTVGNNEASWKIPSSSDSFDKWAHKNHFHIGDSIVFLYDSKTDSVVEVNEEAYKTCNNTNPIKSFHDGKTKITLDKSGVFYFISGVEDHCNKGMKLEVKVLEATHHHHHHHHHSAAAPAPHHHRHHHSPSPSPAPAPAAHNDGATLRVGFMGSLVLALVAALV